VARGRSRRSGRAAVGAAWCVALVVACILTPRLVEGYAALQATRFHARRMGGARVGEHARRAGRAASRVIDLVAPLPWSREAARLALDAAASLEPRNRPSAIAAYDDVQAALERVAASPLRGAGLGALADEARARRDEARAAAAGTLP
jgi:hypothetical protein